MQVWDLKKKIQRGKFCFAFTAKLPMKSQLGCVLKLEKFQGNFLLLKVFGGRISDRKAIIFSLFCFKQICGDQLISITTENSIWNVSHCLTYFSLLWVLVFKLSSHTQCKFASPQNCQKWFSLLPSKSVYGLLSQNHSLKESDWLSNPSFSSVIFNKHFSVVSFREKIIASLCVAGLSGNNARRGGTWELRSLSFPLPSFANSECFQQQGSQRRGEKDRACSHWQSFSLLHWDKDLAHARQHPKPWTKDFTGSSQ